MCNCYDAGGLSRWAEARGFYMTALYGADGRVFVRGLVFCRSDEMEVLRAHAPAIFRLTQIPEVTGEKATCDDKTLKELLHRVLVLTRTGVDETAPRKLPNVGDKVSVCLPPIFEGTPAVVERVAPSTGNVRVLIAGKFWTVPWHLLAQKDNF